MPPAAAERTAEQEIRQLLVSLDPDEDPGKQQLLDEQLRDLEASSKPSNSSCATTASSSSSNRPQQQQLRTAATKTNTALGRREKEVNKRFSAIRSLHGSFPVFDDSKPDPGCQLEQQEFQQHVNPKHVCEQEKEKQVSVFCHPT